MARIYEGYCGNCKKDTSHIKPDFGGLAHCQACHKTIWDKRDGKVKVFPPTIEQRLEAVEKRLAALEESAARGEAP